MQIVALPVVSQDLAEARPNNDPSEEIKQMVRRAALGPSSQGWWGEGTGVAGRPPAAYRARRVHRLPQERVRQACPAGVLRDLQTECPKYDRWWPSVTSGDARLRMERFLIGLLKPRINHAW